MPDQSPTSAASCWPKRAGEGARFLGVLALGLATATATLLAGL